jgi:D-glycero-alpha-D-manno-heptose-7-phosphate kinase
MQESLIKMDLKNMGSILNESWLIKKKINNGATNSFIDEIYQKAIKLGVYGGKLLGAGAGGFLFFVCDPDQRTTILQKLDCKFILPKIDFSGTSVLYQDVVKSV